MRRAVKDFEMDCREAIKPHDRTHSEMYICGGMIRYRKVIHSKDMYVI